LVIVDNLDRIPPSVGNHLFFDYAPQLQELDCTIIYTVPISVIYSYKNVSNLFGNPNIVPMVNIYDLVAGVRFKLQSAKIGWELPV
jgi:hypothetical protein